MFTIIYKSVFYTLHTVSDFQNMLKYLHGFYYVGSIDISYRVGNYTRNISRSIER